MKLEDIAISSIEFYQKSIGKIRSHSPCKFDPSCSEYMKQSIIKYGVLKGVPKGLYRLLRCNPFSKGGYEPVE